VENTLAYYAQYHQNIEYLTSTSERWMQIAENILAMRNTHTHTHMRTHTHTHTHTHTDQEIVRVHY
jgi:hypothetical protein